MGSSKKYKNKICVYCRDTVSTTADHVFPRELFQKDQRAMLPKVPACKKCNNKKSKIELYLLSVLPFGATHDNAEKALSIDVKKRLDKNKKLHRKISKEYGFTYFLGPSGIFEKRMFVKYDNDKLHEFIKFVGCGLMWFHWGEYLPVDCAIKVFTPSATGLKYLEKIFNLKTEFMINTQLGDGTIRYKGVKSEKDDYITAWAVQMFGGLTISDTNQENIFRNSFVAMITGNQRLIDGIEI